MGCPLKSREQVEREWRAAADNYSHLANIPRSKVRDIFAKEKDWYLKNRQVGENDAAIRFAKLQNTMDSTLSNRLELELRVEFLEWLLN